MITLKLFFITFALLVGQFSYANKIVYGFSSGMLPNEIQEFVFRGFLLSLDTFKEIDVKKNLELIYSNSESQTSPIEVAKDVLKRKPIIITGFPSSLESQLASNILVKSTILTIFASSSNSNIHGLSDHIYSTSENVESTNLKIAEEALKLFPNGRGLVIYNPYDFFSMNQKKVWEKILNSKPKLELFFIPTYQDGRIQNEFEGRLKDAKFIITTMFPIKSYNLFRYLHERGVDLPIFTNTSWYKMEFNSLVRFLIGKKKPVFLVKFKNFDPTIAKSIEERYRSIYKSLPTPEVMIGYDLGIIVGSIYVQTLKLNLTPLQIMARNPCFAGSPFGNVCFSGGGGFAPREVKLVDINEKY